MLLSRKFTISLSYLRGIADSLVLIAPHLYVSLTEEISRLENLRRQLRKYDSSAGKCYNIPRDRRYAD